jgi:predicted house-cleaning NTP pyrophosphatase (Maf/HAM1 superfamily)
LLVLTSQLLPEPGTVPAHAERLARLRDLSLRQLARAGHLTLQELVDLVGSIHDEDGGLVVVKKLHAPNSAVVGLGIRYQHIVRVTG